VLRAAVLALTVLTGFSGLVYEVAWQKVLATLLGSHSEATAAVLALFLGGLALGYAGFGRLTRSVVAGAAARGRAPRLLLLYGVVEAGIGLHALAFPWLFDGVRALSAAIPHSPGGFGFALDVALSALLILPPCVLMGGTIPILTQALARGLADATRVHAWVYAFNTAGAFLGALAGGLVLVPWLGLERVIWAMGVVNLFAGALLGTLGLRLRAAVPDADEPVGAPPVAIGVFAASALLIGFSAMAFQTVLIRLGGLSLGSSQFTFAMVVAVFVLCIAIGSFVVSTLPAIGPRLLVGAQWVLAALMAGLYPLLENAPWAAHVVRTWFRDQPASFHPYQLAVFLGALAVLAIPVGLSGAMLPLIFHHLRRSAGDLGAVAGRLYAWNTVGSLLGALLGGYVLLFWLDLHHVYRIALAAVTTSAALLSVRLLALPRVPFAFMVLAPALAGVALLPAWQPERIASGVFRVRTRLPVDYRPARFFDQVSRGSTIVFHEDDPNSTVTVTAAPHARGTDHAIVTNGKPDGSIAIDYPTMALAALVPALFAEQAEVAFVIGYGTGVTVGELGALDAMQRVVVAEISPAVITAGRFFEPDNQGALANPKTEILISDAYRALLRSDRRYDVIASEPSNPWVTGVEMLFSREFLAAARDRLRPGGVYCQWFHVYENDTEVVELVLRTYASVFDHVAVWYALGPDLLLLGFDDPARALDLERLRARAALPDFAAGLRRSGITSFPALLAHELLPLDVVNTAEFQGDLHTLLHPVLSLRAARAFFVGRPASLPPTVRPAAALVGAEHSLLRRLAGAQGGRLSDAEHDEVVAETCKGIPQPCATRVAYWMHQHPDSARRDETLVRLRTRDVLAQHLTPKRLRALTALFAPDGPRARANPEEASRLTALFVEYYLHAAPFSRDGLAAIWRRCSGGAPCVQGLARAEERVGPLRRAVRLGTPAPPG
jgi:spermidine synthase